MRRLIASVALAATTVYASAAFAQQRVDVAVVGGLSDITQFHGQ